MLLRETRLLAQFWVKWQRRMFELTRKKARRPLCWGLSVWPGDQSFCTTTSLEVASKAPMNRVNREGRDASSAWDERAMVFTVMRVGVISPWAILIIIIALNPSEIGVKSHLAVINHHESPLDCHKSHSIPNFYRPKMPRNPPIKGWNPPFSHLFGAMFRGERCFEVDWHNSHLTSLLPEEVRAYRSGKNGWDLLESTVIDGGSSWKLMLKMLTFRNLLVIYDSYGDLIWSNDI